MLFIQALIAVLLLAILWELRDLRMGNARQSTMQRTVLLVLCGAVFVALVAAVSGGK